MRSYDQVTSRMSSCEVAPMITLIPALISEERSANDCGSSVRMTIIPKVVTRILE